MKQLTRRNFLQTGASLTAATALGSLGALSRAQTAPAVIHPSVIDRPNILVIFPDQHRFDWTGLNTRGIPVRTPNLNALAAGGMYFPNAIVASPLCAPSRACLAAGKYYSRCGVPNNNTDYPISQQTFYTLLRDSGYYVMGCGKMDLAKADLNWGPTGKRLLPQWGFSDGINNSGKVDSVLAANHRPLQCPYLIDLQTNHLLPTYLKDMHKRNGGASYTYVHPTPLPETAYADNWEANNGLDLINSAPTDAPWYLQVNFSGVHNPEDITSRMAATVRGITDYPQPVHNTQYPPATHESIRQNYSAMVENIDRWLGIYINLLKQRGELDNTIIVYASDHGEMLGDHNRWGKIVPYHPSVSVPMVFAGPGVAAAAVSQSLVSVMDLASTFLDIAGLPTPGDMDSRSMLPLLSDPSAPFRTVSNSALGNWRMVWDGRYKLIDGFSAHGGYILFDLLNDPFENNNIAHQAHDVVNRLKPLLG